jgi:hypothetical protein
MAAPFSGIGATKILADPRDSLSAFCTFLHHPSGAPLILRTSDGGTTWRDVTGDLGDQSVNALVIDPSEPSDWYAGTDVGVWVTQDGGGHWRAFGLGLPNALVSDLEVQGSFGRLYAATHGRGLWQTEVLSEIAHRQLATTPMLLEVVSRNPSADQFTIEYGARQGTIARLEVVSIHGRRIETLAEAPADGTPRVATWQASGLASGIYFLVLRSNVAHAARKVVLIR